MNEVISGALIQSAMLEARSDEFGQDSSSGLSWSPPTGLSLSHGDWSLARGPDLEDGIVEPSYREDFTQM
jgi:hypothetical protein